MCVYVCITGSVCTAHCALYYVSMSNLEPKEAKVVGDDCSHLCLFRDFAWLSVAVHSCVFHGKHTLEVDDLLFNSPLRKSKSPSEEIVNKHLFLGSWGNNALRAGFLWKVQGVQRAGLEDRRSRSLICREKLTRQLCFAVVLVVAWWFRCGLLVSKVILKAMA